MPCSPFCHFPEEIEGLEQACSSLHHPIFKPPQVCSSDFPSYNREGSFLYQSQFFCFITTGSHKNGLIKTF